VTAFPNVVFSGTVQEVRVNPTVVQNVVTYDAVVQVHDTSGRLLPGMTAQVNIEIGRRQHVLAVPIAAVLYRPLASQPSGGFAAGLFQASNSAPSAAPVAGAPGSHVTVWLLQDGRPAPLQVVIGLTDGTNIEITGGNLQAGDPVIIAQRRGAGGGGTSGRGGGGAPAGSERGSPSTQSRPPESAGVGTSR